MDVSTTLATFDNISPGAGGVWRTSTVSTDFSEYQNTTANISESLQDPSQYCFSLNGFSAQPSRSEFDPHAVYHSSGTSVDIPGPTM
jgi:hypothetical protein